jgi:Uncharacterized protein predicted to be involved in DNA repair (RAMP superfamily)
MVRRLHLYRVIEIENLEPLKIGAAGSKANQIEPSRDFVPGSTLRGALIHAFIQREMFEPRKREILLNLECWNAYPYHRDRLYIPTPLHIRVNKHKWRKAKAHRQSFVKLVNLLNSSGDKGKNHLEYRYVAADGDGLAGHKVPKTYRIHHSTIRNADKEEKENLFRYQAISEHQTFRGIIRYPEELRSCLDEVLREPIETWLGGSKGSGYGRSVLKAVDEATTDFQEARRRTGFSFTREVKEGCPLLTVVCLSDCVCRDGYGQPINHIPEAELSEWLRQKVELKRQWVEHTLTEGYNSTWRKRYPKESALRAGSVFVYKLDRPLSEREMDQLEERLIGSRTQDGFGWIGVNLKIPDQIVVEEVRQDDSGVVPVKVKENRWAALGTDQRRVLHIITRGFASNKDSWLIMKANRLMSEGIVRLDDGLKSSHLRIMIEGLKPVLAWLRDHGPRPDQNDNKRSFNRDYLKDADLCSICGVHYRNLLTQLKELKLAAPLSRLAEEQISQGKGRLHYPDSRSARTKARFIAELFHTCLTIQDARKGNENASGAHL